MVSSSTHEIRAAARSDVARRGLAAEFGGRPVLDLARELAEISRAGLRRIGHAGTKEGDERSFLEPIFEQLRQGVSPGQLILDRWEGEWEKSLDRLIEYARY